MGVTCVRAPKRRDSTERKSKKIFKKVISQSPSKKKNKKKKKTILRNPQTFPPNLPKKPAQP